jgi:hypothetical protein
MPLFAVDFPWPDSLLDWLDFCWTMAVGFLFSPAGAMAAAMVGVGLVCIGVGWYRERRKHRSSVQ